MQKDDLGDQILRRVATSGKLMVTTAGVALALLGIVFASFFMETFDSEIESANHQLRLYVLSNTENFEKQNDKALKKAAWNLVRGSGVSHVAVYDPLGRVLVWQLSTRYSSATPVDQANILLIQSKSKLAAETRGTDLIKLELPSGMVIYRAFTPVRKGAMKLAEVEIGFFKSEILSRTIKRLQFPAAVGVSCVFLLIPVGGVSIRRWERTKSTELTRYIEAKMEKVETEYKLRLAEQAKEHETKEVDGGNFFNILEAMRDVSGAADLPAFIRRTVLSSVRLFRCKMVGFYVFQNSEGQPPSWTLSGRYDGKGYAHDQGEKLDVESHERLKEALSVGATELLQGYPADSTQTLLITIASQKPLGAILLYNKVGMFDSRDILAARIFSGFLPNLLAWHIKP